KLLEVVKHLDADVDFLAWQLRPVALDDLGLLTALKNYVRQWSEHFGLACEVRASNVEQERFPPHIETNFYRITQEALNNSAKHSKCTHAEVLLERKDGQLMLIIEDNGIGFDPDQALRKGRRWGLVGIRERAVLLHGTAEIESSPGKGTTLFVRVPLP